MRRFLWVAACFALACLALGPPALADPPVTVHDQLDARFTVADFCGSGLAVDVVVNGVQNLHVDGETFQGTGRFRATISNPASRASVVVSAAGQILDEVVSGDPYGVHTHLVTFKGLPEKIQLAGGEVLLRDAGVIAFADTFDGDQFLDSEVVFDKGPHPEAESDFALFCTTIISALS